MAFTCLHTCGLFFSSFTKISVMMAQLSLGTSTGAFFPLPLLTLSVLFIEKAEHIKVQQHCAKLIPFSICVLKPVSCTPVRMQVDLRKRCVPARDGDIISSFGIFQCSVKIVSPLLLVSHRSCMYRPSPSAFLATPLVLLNFFYHLIFRIRPFLLFHDAIYITIHIFTSPILHQSP
jgi:hypothetical protein